MNVIILELILLFLNQPLLLLKNILKTQKVKNCQNKVIMKELFFDYVHVEVLMVIGFMQKKLKQNISDHSNHKSRIDG